jgi:hypothetical protein
LFQVAKLFSATLRSPYLISIMGIGIDDGQEVVVEKGV